MKAAAIVLSAAAAVCLAPSVASARDATDGEWAACMRTEAPGASRNWIALGKPGQGMDPATLERSRHLAFRLRAACGRTLYPGQPAERFGFKLETVWQALSRKGPIMAGGRQDDDPRAFFCRTSFITKDASAFVKAPTSLPATLADGAPVKVTGYDVLGPGDTPVMMTTGKQSSGAPLYLFRACRHIAVDGTLTDA